LKLRHRRGRQRFALDSPPRHKAFSRRRQRTNPSLQPIGDNEQLVIGEERGKLRFIFPDILVSIKPHPLVSCARRESILTRVA
jgi:hypothetical protein